MGKIKSESLKLFYVNVKWMLEKLLNEDKVLDELIIKSGFSRKQLDYIIVRKEFQGKINEIITKTDEGKVSKAAYLITKDRGITNIKKAFYTLILAYYLGIIPKESFVALEKIATLMDNVKGRILTKEQIDNIIITLENLLEQLINA
ncbi:MAG: hypothetical protein QXL89_01630 [Nitrososphaeria archaeon]